MRIMCFLLTEWVNSIAKGNGPKALARYGAMTIMGAKGTPRPSGQKSNGGFRTKTVFEVNT